MRRTIPSLFVAALATVLIAAPVAAGYQTQIGVNATEWTSATTLNPSAGIYPIGGSGQVNGEFVTGERDGIQIAIRAQERFAGPTMVPEAHGRRGDYNADAGFSDAQERATWNYDLHVDLRGATGAYAGTTLEDYKLVLNSNISKSWFGCKFPCDLVAFINTIDNGVLFQTSQNPKFGNPDFDATKHKTYHFEMTLKPETFNAPNIKVHMHVVVS